MNLTQWRKRKNLKMGQAAEILDIPQPTISRIESGVHLPSSKTIAKLTKASKGAITAADLYRHWESVNGANA